VNSLLVLKDVMLQWGGPGGYGGGMWPGMMWGYGAGWLMAIFNIVFWVVLIVAIVYFIKWLSASSKQKGNEKRGDSALEILRERYAKGEIGKDEFEEKKKALKG
jgi:putative membrane protein